MADEHNYQNYLTAEEDVIQQRIRRGVRAYQRQAVIGFIILFLGIVAAGYIERQHNAEQRNQIQAQAVKQDKRIVKSGNAITVGGCNRDYDTIDALRDQLEVSLVRIDSLEADGTYTARQAQVARESTDDFLAKYTLPDCRKADEVLTFKPGEPINVPSPRYPDDPKQQASEAAEAKKFGRPVNGP